MACDSVNIFKFYEINYESKSISLSALILALRFSIYVFTH